MEDVEPASTTGDAFGTDNEAIGPASGYGEFTEELSEEIVRGEWAITQGFLFVSK